MSGIRSSSIARVVARYPVTALVLLSWLGFPALALAGDGSIWLAELLRFLMVPAYASGLGLFLLTRGILGSLTWPVAFLGTVVIAVTLDRHLRSWSTADESEDPVP